MPDGADDKKYSDQMCDLSHDRHRGNVHRQSGAVCPRA